MEFNLEMNDTIIKSKRGFMFKKIEALKDDMHNEMEEKLLKLMEDNNITFWIMPNDPRKNDINIIDLIEKPGYPNIIYFKLNEFLEKEHENGIYKIYVPVGDIKIPLFFDYEGNKKWTIKIKIKKVEDGKTA